MNRVAVLGTGPVGLGSAALLASLGHEPMHEAGLLTLSALYGRDFAKDLAKDLAKDNDIVPALRLAELSAADLRRSLGETMDETASPSPRPA